MYSHTGRKGAVEKGYFNFKPFMTVDEMLEYYLMYMYIENRAVSTLNLRYTFFFFLVMH